MYGYWYWADGNVPIKSVDFAAKTASHYPARVNQRYYYNIPEDLDGPGECYVDRDANILCFNPPAPLAGKSMNISLMKGPVVRIDDASHITFRDISFGNSRGDGVVIDSGDHHRISNSTIANLGGWGARIQGGSNNIVTQSEITRTGRGLRDLQRPSPGHCLRGQ